MDERVKKLWVEALRSGEFIQGHGQLRIIDEETGKPKDCCLGILCELFRQERPTEGRWIGDTATLEFIAGDLTAYDDEEGCGPGCEARDDVLPYAVQQWAGLDDNNPVLVTETANGEVELEASEWNDGHKKPDGGWVRPPATFTDIAKMVEEYL